MPAFLISIRFDVISFGVFDSKQVGLFNFVVVRFVTARLSQQLQYVYMRLAS